MRIHVGLGGSGCFLGWQTFSAVDFGVIAEQASSFEGTKEGSFMNGRLDSSNLFGIRVWNVFKHWTYCSLRRGVGMASLSWACVEVPRSEVHAAVWVFLHHFGRGSFRHILQLLNAAALASCFKWNLVDATGLASPQRLTAMRRLGVFVRVAD